jgi:hypothetical protein
MKGPGHRSRHDVRRVWECPACRRREKTPGTVVFRRCSSCAGKEPDKEIWMRLVEDTPVRRRLQPKEAGTPDSESQTTPTTSREDSDANPADG